MKFDNQTAKTALKVTLIALSVFAGLLWLLFTLIAAMLEIVSDRAIDQLRIAELSDAKEDPTIEQDIEAMAPISAKLFDVSLSVSEALPAATETVKVVTVKALDVTEIGYHNALKIAKDMGAKFSKSPKKQQLQDWFNSQIQAQMGHVEEVAEIAPDDLANSVASEEPPM